VYADHVQTTPTSQTNNDLEREETYISFIYKARWFVVSQTECEALKPISISQWKAEQALTNLNIEMIAFDLMDGKVQGFARG